MSKENHNPDSVSNPLHSEGTQPHAWVVPHESLVQEVNVDSISHSRNTTNDNNDNNENNENNENNNNNNNNDDMSPVVHARSGNGFQQFGATMIKNFHQKRRAWISLLAEILLPPLFICGLIGIWAASGTNWQDAEQYVEYEKNAFQINYPGMLETLACYNATPIEGLYPCNDPTYNVIAQKIVFNYKMNSTATSLEFSCLDDLNGADRIPVKGVCFAIAQKNLVDSLFGYSGLLSKSIMVIPTFDQMVLIQWLAKGINIHTWGQFRKNIGALVTGGLLFFSPKSAEVEKMIEAMNTSTKFFRYAYKGTYDSLSESNDELIMKKYEGSVWGSINFKELTSEKMNVEIGVNRSAFPETNLNIIEQYGGGYPDSAADLYVASGFSTLQRTINEIFITQFQNKSLPPEPTLAPTGFSKYKSQTFLLQAGQIAPLIVVLSFLYPVSQVTKRIVLEKELRIREAMLIMGLSTFSFYLSWLVTYAIQYLICSILATILMCVTFTPKSDPLIVFFLFYFFSLSCVALSTLMASFFSRARVAALVSPFLFLILSMPIFAVSSAPSILIGFFAFLSPSAFAVGLQNLFRHELGGGLGPEQFVSAHDTFNTAVVYFYLIIDTIIYLILTPYFDAVIPSEWGTTRSPCFCITDPIRWCYRRCCGGKQRSDDIEEEMKYDGKDKDGAYEENGATVTDCDHPDSNMVPEHSVMVRGLCKSFKRGKETFKAVDGMSWNLQEGSISVLLGHNGAGKTTTINLMTGMLPIDKGDCIIFGQSVRYNLSAARREIGFCPQHNIIWPELTCDEHLRFYARLKGVTGSKQDEMVESMLRAVDLWDKRNQLSSTLSGGQKRKLSVAIAFVGGSRLVFLDEPTAGMDVNARRFTWDLIKKMSVGRCIVLTTHFMDEADLLGSSISIMSKGRLKCSGSSHFLKSKLGVGYTLTMSVTAHASSAKIEERIKKHVSEAEEVSSAPGEIAMRLPMNAVDHFPDMLRMLEEHGTDIGVRGFGIAVTTLEEVFLRIAHNDEEQVALQERAQKEALRRKQEETEQQNSTTSVPVDAKTDDSIEVIKLTDAAMRTAEKELAAEREQRQTAAAEDVWNAHVYDTEKALVGHQMQALLLKRFRNARRDCRTVFLQIVFPVVCVLLAMLLSLLDFESTKVIHLNVNEGYGKENQVILSNCDDLLSKDFGEGVKVDTFTGMANGKDLSLKLADEFFKHSTPRFSAMYCTDPAMAAAYVLGRNTTQPVSTLLGNITAFHTYGITTQAYYAQYMKKTASAASLEATAQVLPFTDNEKAVVDGIKSVLTAMIIMIPFTFIPSTFVAWIVKERQCKARHLQNVSGVRFFVYWISNLIFDLVSFLLSELLVIIVFFIFNRKEYIGSGDAFGALFMLFFFYGLSGIAAAYLVSFIFKEYSTAQNIVMIANFIAGFLLVLAVYILSIIDSTKNASDVLRWIFRVIPPYCLGEGIINLATLKIYKDFGYTDKAYELKTITVGWPILFMAIEFPIFFILTLIIDHPARRTRSQKFFHNPDKKPDPIEDEDEDVAKERAEVEGGERDSDLVLVKHMRKVYPNGKVAVRNISFGVHPGEVFGFLGTNGAGKTTTISILCQEQMPTNGRGTIVGADLVNDSAQALRYIGYCPQFDALLDLLTPQEHLQLYAGIRGIVRSEVSRIVESLLRICELTEHRNTLSMNMSGGNRRKLSVALSLIGGPRVVFLDEPSAGMDPVARRGLWKAIEVIADNCSVVLTTHHLEEVEALAHRVAIMVDGSLKCIGDKTHLKNKYGSGFEMYVKVNDAADNEPLQKFVEENIPGATCSENRNNKLTFALPQGTKLSQVFELMQSHQQELRISDYLVSQTSIESVFLRISEQAENIED